MFGRIDSFSIQAHLQPPISRPLLQELHYIKSKMQRVNKHGRGFQIALPHHDKYRPILQTNRRVPSRQSVPNFQNTNCEHASRFVGDRSRTNYRFPSKQQSVPVRLSTRNKSFSLIAHDQINLPLRLAYTVAASSQCLPVSDRLPGVEIRRVTAAPGKPFTDSRIFP